MPSFCWGCILFRTKSLRKKVLQFCTLHLSVQFTGISFLCEAVEAHRPHGHQVHGSRTAVWFTETRAIDGGVDVLVPWAVRARWLTRSTAGVSCVRLLSILDLADKSAKAEQAVAASMVQADIKIKQGLESK